LIIKHPIVYHEAEMIEDIFKTCCMLHNLIQAWDQEGTSAWESEVDWEQLNPSGLEEEEGEESLDIVLSGSLPEDNNNIDVPDVVVVSADADPRHDDFARVLTQELQQAIAAEVDVTVQYRYEELRESLVTSFRWQYMHGKVYWPKAFTKQQRGLMPIAVPSVVTRIRTDLTGVLYHKPSLLRAKTSLRGQYSRPIGDGLFSQIRYKKNDLIVSFIGELVSFEEVEARTEAGRGGYILEITKEEYLDCYHYRHVCMASYANDPRYCWNFATGVCKQAKPNCRVVLNRATRVISLKADKDILPHVELLWVYGGDYVFPV
jgi:hypothetical protein